MCACALVFFLCVYVEGSRTNCHPVDHAVEVDPELNTSTLQSWGAVTQEGGGSGRWAGCLCASQPTQQSDRASLGARRGCLSHINKFTLTFLQSHLVSFLIYTWRHGQRVSEGKKKVRGGWHASKAAPPEQAQSSECQAGIQVCCIDMGSV